MKPDWVTDDERRYEVLADRVNIHREKWAWFFLVPRGARREVIESDLIGHHMIEPETPDSNLFFRCINDEHVRTATGPFISRF